MNCYYHPDRVTAAQCVVCGKNLCSECSIIKEGRTYCKECLQTGEAEVDTGKIFVPALACGAVAGLLSFALWDSFLSCLCCVWVVLAGGLAVYLLKRFNNIEGKISLGKASLTGGFVGFVASLIMSAALFIREDFDTIMDEAMRQPEVQEALREAGITSAEAGGVAAIAVVVVIVMLVVVLTLFGVLGGIIGNEITK